MNFVFSLFVYGEAVFLFRSLIETDCLCLPYCTFIFEIQRFASDFYTIYVVFMFRYKTNLAIMFLSFFFFNLSFYFFDLLISKAFFPS